MELSVVIPAKNEADNIVPLVTEISQSLNDKYDYEIIYVDDGSEDRTFSILTKIANTPSSKLTVIKHACSVGQSTAIYTGVHHAKGRLIVTLDADGQNDPANIPELLELANHYSHHQHFCIAGYRKKRKDTRWKRFQSQIANKVRKSLLGDDTPDTGCGLKVFPKHTYQKLPYFDHMHRFLPALIKRLGGEIVVVEVNHRERMSGESKYTMLGRLGVGIVDMLGVMWLQKRCKLPQVINDDAKTF